MQAAIEVRKVNRTFKSKGRGKDGSRILVALDNIDGYRPDDSDFDPTAQGFEYVEVQEGLRS